MTIRQILVSVPAGLVLSVILIKLMSELSDDFRAVAMGEPSLWVGDLLTPAMLLVALGVIVWAIVLVSLMNWIIAPLIVIALAIIYGPIYILHDVHDWIPTWMASHPSLLVTPVAPVVMGVMMAAALWGLVEKARSKTLHLSREPRSSNEHIGPSTGP